MAPKQHNDFSNRVGFCIGTGRCGTTFLSELAKREPDVAASHERLRLGATFHMFCKWHHIPIDSEGFLLDREEAIRQDLSGHSFSLECSALLSHSLEELYDRFGAKFLLLVRSPAETVASFAVRGWFLQPCARKNPNLPPSYREGEEPRHFLGRNIPHGVDFERWTGLTQIGRLAWFWQARNRAILEQFRRLPTNHCYIQRLEDLDYSSYRKLTEFFGWQTQLTEQTFTELANARLNAGPNTPRRFPEWNATESAEFESEVAEVASALGYEYQVSKLAKQDALSVSPSPPSVSDVLSRPQSRT